MGKGAASAQSERAGGHIPPDMWRFRIDSSSHLALFSLVSYSPIQSGTWSGVETRALKQFINACDG
jgi:hypothetical protein